MGTHERTRKPLPRARRSISKPADSFGPGTVASILDLQRKAGNRAVTAYIQRDLRKDDGAKPKTDESSPDAAGDDPIPGRAVLGQQATNWIEQVWGALNTGLQDFEHSAAVTDWNAFAMNVLGNLIWATAAFATGGTAFAISLAGIALSAKASASAVTSLGDFHNVSRAETDQIATTLKKNAPSVVDRVYGEAKKSGLSGRETFSRLMRQLLKPEYIDDGPIPSVNSPKISALTETNLLLRSGATRSTDWLGWERGDWWVQYAYRAEGAMDPRNSFSQWRLSRASPDAELYPVDTPIQQTRDRINQMRQTMGGAHAVRDWPLRKVLKLYVRGSFALVVTLDGDNRLTGLKGEYLDPTQVASILKVAGWDASGQGLVNWVWRDSGGLPPDIGQLR